MPLRGVGESHPACWRCHVSIDKCLFPGHHMWCHIQHDWKTQWSNRSRPESSSNLALWTERLELAYTDALKEQMKKQYDKVVTGLIGIYFYMKSSVQRKQLKNCFRAMGLQPQVPSRSGGNRWMAHIIHSVKLASNDFGCMCEQIWKEQCRMKAYITINWTKWFCSKSLIKFIITMKNTFFTLVMPLKRVAIIGYM